MRHLLAPLRGLVLDHLKFEDVLSATATDRTGRAALGYIRRVYSMKSRIMTSGIMINKLTMCECLDIDSKDGLVWERVGWALQAMTRLRDVHIMFGRVEELDMPSWRSWCHGCATLALSPEVGRLRMLRPEVPCGTGTGHHFRDAFNCDEFKSLLLRLSPDCALDIVLQWDFYCHFPFSLIAELVRRGANLNAKIPSIFRDCEPWYPLDLACLTCSRLEVVQLFLDKGAISRDRARSGGQDLFCGAVIRGSVDVLRLLYDAGYESTMKVKEDNLLALFAYVFDHLDAATTLSIVELICERQPSLLTEINDSGDTPLMILEGRFNTFRNRMSPPDRLALFESLRKCMLKHEANFRQRTAARAAAHD